MMPMLDFVLLSPAELIANSGVIAAFATSIAIIVLSFIGGEALSIPSVKGFAKNEAYELGVSAVIFLILLLFIANDGVFDRVTKGFMMPGVPVNRTCSDWASLHGPYDETSQTYANGSVAFGQADYFLGCRPNILTIISGGYTADGIMLRKLTRGYQSLMLTEMFVGFLSGLNTNLLLPTLLSPILSIDVGVSPFIGMTQILDIHTLIVDLVGSLWGAFAAQKVLLRFIEETALPIFLPLGLMLRALPFSRKTGSTIIAVVFAAYFVYPISILINQHIFEAISNPTENPNSPPGFICPSNNKNCCPLEDPCTADNECCSNNCRYIPSKGSKVCVTPLTDFAEYESIYAMCYGEKNWSKVNDTLEKMANSYNDAMDNIYYGGVPPSSSIWTKTEGRLREFGAEIMRKAAAMAGLNEALMMPNPRKVVVASFAEVEMLVMDVSQFAMLAVIFIVLEIVVTMTLLKDIALLIGGEPRVLGISQLV